jgi:hypothetical protein
MVSNLLKRWRDDSATVKRKRDGFGAFRKKKRDAIPPHLALSQVLLVMIPQFKNVCNNATPWE